MILTLWLLLATPSVRELYEIDELRKSYIKVSQYSAVRSFITRKERWYYLDKIIEYNFNELINKSNISVPSSRETLLEKDLERDLLKQQVAELYRNPNVKTVYYADKDYLYYRRKGKTFAAQMTINKLPVEKVLRKSL